MNSRERIMATLSHKEPDKIPIDMNGTIATAITLVAYNNLRKHLGIGEDKDPHISFLALGTVRVKDDIREKYQIDTRPVWMKDSQKTPTKWMDDGTYYDDVGLRWKKASFYYDIIERPLANATTLGDLDNAKWSSPYDSARVRGLKEEAKRLYEETTDCIIADIPSWGPFEGAAEFCGFDKFLTDLYYNKKFAVSLLDRITDMAISFWDAFLTEVGDYVQVVCQGDDVGAQKAPFMSPSMFKEFIKPCHKRIFDFIHSKTKAKVMLHTDGSVYDYMADFIESGVDVFTPIQRSAAKMDIVKLKKDFGNDISFWGGGKFYTNIGFMTPEEVKEEVKKTIDILAPGGGYVFFTTHNIQPDVPGELIDAMYSTVLDNRDYKNFK